MNIIDKNLKFSGLKKRVSTKTLVLHHADMNGTVEDVHRIHINQGWSGIGYHLYIRKDGSVYRGRPIEMVGAHCYGHNFDTIGICFEGNYEAEKNMPEVQKRAGLEAIKYVKSIYGNLNIVGHKELFCTACPGKYFPLDYMKNTSFDSVINEQKIKEEKAKKEEIERMKILNLEGEDGMIYNYIDDNSAKIASDCNECLSFLVAKGYLKGNEKGELNLTEPMIRLLLINYRAGLYK